MRVVHLIWSLSTGGVETMLVDIINEQVKHALVSLIVMNDSVDSELIRNLDKLIEEEVKIPINRATNSLESVVLGGGLAFDNKNLLRTLEMREM